MNEMVLDVWIPVTIPDVEVACHDYHDFNISCVVS